jgi:hypothetical protein
MAVERLAVPNRDKQIRRLTAIPEFHVEARVHMSEGDLPLPPELGRLSTFIDSHIECLGGSSSELCSIALCAAKHVFEWGEIGVFEHLSKV